MRIGIDARFFGPIGKGLGRYTQRLVEHLEQVADDHEFVVFLRKENFDLFTPTSPRFRKVLADFRWYSLAEQIKFPPLIRKESIDLMHFPHFNIPVLTPCPFVVTIHDLILLRFPTKRATRLNWLTYALKYAAYKQVIRMAARRSKKVIAVSKYTKQDILKAFNVESEKVAVTYEASDGVEAGQLSIPGTLDLASHGITKPYFLYVGNAYPHKNLERLLHVFRNIKTKGLNAQLVLVGKPDYFYDRLERSEDVIFYGFAKEEELAELYRNARAYVFPSLFEGFGLPPLEAMRYGTPVAASDATCLPEILGDAALYFDARDEDSMASAMIRIFNDKELRDDLSEKGLVRVEKYSWRRCAEETYDIYLKAIKK